MSDPFKLSIGSDGTLRVGVLPAPKPTPPKLKRTEPAARRPRRINKSKARDMLARLDGAAPYNEPSNTSWGDGYYARSIERKFQMPLDEIRKLVGMPDPGPRSYPFR
jgi:hypothetical protein